MPFRSRIHKDRLHHAYIIEGAHTDCVPKLLSFVETELAMPIVGNPNIWREHFEAFGIDEGRRLKEMQSLRAVSGDRKIFILSVNSITFQAQNALLKVLEEPTVGTHFFFVLPTTSMLLPTIFSRVVLIQTHESAHSTCSGQADVLAKKFSESPVAERLKIAKVLSESEDRGVSRDFVNALERYWYSKVGSKNLADYHKWFGSIAKCRSYLSDRSPSVKMLLEHLVLSLPKK